MRPVGILPALRRRPKLVGLGALAAVALALFTTHRVALAPPQIQAHEPASGVAEARVLVDTPRSLVAASRVTGDDTILARAALLGNLLASDDARGRIAKRAGVDASALAVVNPSLGIPVTATPLSRDASEASLPSQPNVISVSAENPEVPIISVVANASDPETASQLTQSATAALISLGGQGDNGDGGVEITQLGAVAVGRVAAGTDAAKTLFVAIVAFGLWCTAVVLFDWVTRRPMKTNAPTTGGGATPGTRRSGSPAQPHRLNGGAPRRLGPARR